MDSPGGLAVTDALARLRALHPKRIDLSLGRIERLLARMDHPERKLPPVLHVAGTNGKGSTIAFTRAIAEAAGLRVHAYTSPHLVRFNERIRLAGSLIDDQTLSDLILEVEDINAGEPITFFEVTTAMAMLIFSRVPADLTLLEVGLGGRFDATNVLERPEACAITPVSLDHADFLGDNVAGIAAEKAGILKQGAAGVIGPQLPAAEAMIRRIAREKRAPISVFGQDWTAGQRGRGAEARLIYRDSCEQLELPMPSLAGAHQIINAGIAVALMRRQEAVTIPLSAIKAGLGWGRWPARLHAIDRGPLTQRLNGRGALWLDGGHNPGAAQVLKAHFRSLDPGRQRLFLIIAMQNNKDAVGFLRPFVGLAERCYTVPVPDTEAGHSPGELALIASSVGLTAQPMGSPGSALDRIMQDCPSDVEPVVLIAGSLYLAGDVLRQSGLEPD
ncbi:MAG: bifunctional folylpolyglutamate synthase/dihydrofolate synthase [Rhodothalassiaceae bacterium]